MRRPWHVWSLGMAILGAVLTAMLWLTYVVLDVDRNQRQAQVRADLERDVGTALWRMDAELARVLAQEIARPVSAYQGAPTRRASASGKGRSDQPSALPTSIDKFPVVSSLLWQRPDFVLLHFQVDETGRWQSPQVPEDRFADVAVAHGVSVEQLEEARERLERLSSELEPATLLARLPSQELPEPKTLLAQSNYLATNQFEAMQNEWLPQNGSSYLANSQLRAPQAAGQRAEQPLPSREAGQPASGTPHPGDPSNVDVLPPEAFPQQAANPFPQILGVPAQSEGDTSYFTRQARDLQQRNTAFQSMTQQQLATSRVVGQPAQLEEPVESAEPIAEEAISLPVWIDDHLLLARRVRYGEESVVQGCWIDWDLLRRHLLMQVEDLLPEADLVPLTESMTPQMNRVLAGLPVMLEVLPRFDSSQDWSPLQLSLAIAWGCLLLAAAALAILVRGILALSERRASFVSAVTHELRTPLTTFRMYAEMLAEDMVPPADRQDYLVSLQHEADRLYHLVENVLQYARLERGAARPAATRLSLGELVAGWETRLDQRARQSEMQCVVKLPAALQDRTLRTNPSAVEQILFNLVDNACKYAQSAEDRRVHVEIAEAGTDRVRIVVSDHGPGVDRSVRERLFEPFSKSAQEAAVTAPGVGLGLALCQRLAKEIGGSLQLIANDSSGAAFELCLQLEEA